MYDPATVSKHTGLSHDTSYLPSQVKGLFNIRLTIVAGIPIDSSHLNIYHGTIKVPKFFSDRDKIVAEQSQQLTKCTALCLHLSKLPLSCQVFHHTMQLCYKLSFVEPWLHVDQAQSTLAVLCHELIDWVVCLAQVEYHLPFLSLSSPVAYAIARASLRQSSSQLHCVQTSSCLLTSLLERCTRLFTKLITK